MNKLEPTDQSQDRTWGPVLWGCNGQIEEGRLQCVCVGVVGKEQ